MVMDHKEWMKLTYGGLMATRSNKLKAIDSALENYHKFKTDRNLKILQGAMVAWMAEKGNGWKTSVRNKHNAVDSLFRQVNGLGGPKPIDMNAKRAIEDEGRQIMLVLFRGAQLSWKNEFIGKLNSDLVKPHKSGFAPYLAARQLKTSAATNKFGTAINSASAVSNSIAANSLRTGGGTGNTSELISKFVAQIVPPDAQIQVLDAVKTLVPSFQAEFTASVMPIAGLITAAGGTVWNTATATSKQFGISHARTHLERSLAGVEAEQAINALIRILVRERNADIFSAGVSLTEFGGKLAGLAIDGGVASNTAVSLAANIAKLMNIIRIVYRDVSEKNAVNKVLMQGKIDLSIFEVSPLVGCYMICASPTSVLMSLILERFGHAGWMDAAERTATRHIQPLREQAREVISSHRFEIRSLSHFPGMLEVNKDELKRMIGMVGNSKYAGGGPGAFLSN